MATITEENTYCVYYHRNTVNNKYYVGQTKQKPEKRWLEGRGYKDNEHFSRAIKKYGWDAFEHIIVAQGLSKEDADKMEIKLIQEYDSTNSECGYNHTPGGEGRCIKHTEESKKKMRKKAKERMSDPEYLFKWKQETEKQKISVVCFETEIVYSSIFDAADSVPGTSRAHIIDCCKHRRKTSGGFHWLYLEEFTQYEKDYWSSIWDKKISDETRKEMSKKAKERASNPEYLLKMRERAKKKSVVCLESKTIYSCASEAAEQNPCVSKIHINECCNGRRRSCGGFHWCFLEEYNPQGDDA